MDQEEEELLVTNQVSERFCERCNTILPPRSTGHISHYWQYGIYEKDTVIAQKTNLMPWLKMTKDTLWYCSGDELFGLNRAMTGSTTSNSQLFSRFSCQCYIDTTLENLIAGLENGVMKIQRHPDMGTPERNICYERETCINIIVRDEVRSLSVDPMGVKFAVGSSGTTVDIPPLHVIDIERYTEFDTM